jgi:1-acyl-sn-glycerol-3-phosphate acyltransferase
MPKKKKKQKWRKLRHRIVWALAYLVLYPYTRIKYRVKIKRYKEKKKRPLLVLFNHQTALDQFIVGAGLQGPVYYVASEDLFSNGKISRLLEWAIAPIPIKKQATDARAVLNCMRVVKEGGTIALAPEGNRTYSGKTEYIKPAIVGLARTLKLPIAFYRIEGGYGVHPRWSDTVRRGKIRAYVDRVLEVEEYSESAERTV